LDQNPRARVCRPHGGVSRPKQTGWEGQGKKSVMVTKEAKTLAIWAKKQVMHKPKTAAETEKGRNGGAITARAPKSEFKKPRRANVPSATGVKGGTG